MEKAERVAFGLFEADLHSGELWKAGYRIKLPRQPFRVLAALLAHPGDIITREELQHEIWGENTNVDFDQAIAAAINKVREALGDSAENPRFIQDPYEARVSLHRTCLERTLFKRAGGNFYT